MIIDIDFTGRRPAATALDHATREAARAYADQMLDGWRTGFPLIVRDEPADALYQRSPTILAEQVEHLAIDALKHTAKEEIAARSYHERVVAMAGALAFQRRTGQSGEPLIAALTGQRGQSVLADSMAIQRRLCGWTSEKEHEVWMAIEMARVDRFLDRNWAAIGKLTESVAKAKPDADGWRVLSAQQVDSILRRRPVKLSLEERSRLQSRRMANTLAAGGDIARRLQLGKA